ncbi:hypothetical protein GCM10011289_24070 [Paludibacterium paludis]|uniref:DUF3995 domain-containing protein n=3 Tax=Paludibacterium paludis TaxID=1225769 RepID=A0A918UAZ2_9NEIS|nr:hypothetical protein GCM10011289_24070 [Paludibacterium paludis]
MKEDYPMTMWLAAVLCGVFVILGAWHLYWAAGGLYGKAAAIPEVDGRRVFEPSAGGTALVGMVLIACAGLVAIQSGLLAVPVPDAVRVWPGRLLAAGLMARAVGDFRLVGFFKRIKGSVFARQDTRFYSPLCLLLGLGVLAV